MVVAVAVAARHLYRLAIAHDLEREVVPRPRDLLELVDVNNHGRRPHRVRLPAQPGHELVDDVRLAGGHHVAEVEARRSRRRREVGQRPQHQVVRLRNVHL